MSGGEALFVGEANPYGASPEYALYPYPERSAGGRLCRFVLGLPADEYLERFDRVNLCRGAWSIREARQAADGIASRRDIPRLILLGSQVCRAFKVDFAPFSSRTVAGIFHLVIIPHPSGLCRLWYRPGAVEEARRALGSVGIELPALKTSLVYPEKAS